MPKIKDIAKTELLRRWEEFQRFSYPNVPERALVLKPNFYSRISTTNGLTQAVITYIELKGWTAERVNNTGRRIDNTKEVTDVLGHRKVIGSTKWIKGTGKDGTADIHASMEGKNIKIEIKNSKTKDKQSKNQKQYQREIELTGGVYWIVGNFTEAFALIEQYEDNPLKHEVWKLKK